jgi:outer membrane protein OmpA-like peptidoglycan-associated protein
MGPFDLEEEFRWQQNDINRLGGVRANGIRSAYAFMTNLLYNFNFGLPIPVVPHLGVGVGAVELRDGLSVPGVGTIGGGTDWELGYQGIAGIRYNVNPSLAFDVDYRYLGTTDPTFRFRGVAAPGRYKSEYSSNSVLASFIVKFGAAPPPPPPVAAPPAPPAPPPIVRKVFLVFFDWDKATITPEGMQIVQQAAAAWRSGAPVQIQVTGYTDTSGSPGYNQRLSERRANNVAVALIRSGVPRTEMVVSGRGENDLRVPTPPGVREPQNRRVEIVFP